MTKLRLKRPEPPSSENSAPELSHGILTEWNDERGYGFITSDTGGQKVFLHMKSLLPSARRPARGEIFFYKLTVDGRGRLRAEQAFQTHLDEKRSLPFPHSVIRGIACFCPSAFIPSVAVTAKTGSFTLGLSAAFIINSLLTILFYWEDKYRAQYGYWRLPEMILHFWEFGCGWPGALYAQQAFRHKRRKFSFMVVFWLCVTANVIALFFLLRCGKPPALGRKLMELWQEMSALSG